MIKCPICEKLVGTSSVAYKASSGFLDEDGIFHDDIFIIIHKECKDNYLYGPFEKIEEEIKNS